MLLVNQDLDQGIGVELALGGITLLFENSSLQFEAVL